MPRHLRLEDLENCLEEPAPALTGLARFGSWAEARLGQGFGVSAGARAHASPPLNRAGLAFLDGQEGGGYASLDGGARGWFGLKA